MSRSNDEKVEGILDYVYDDKQREIWPGRRFWFRVFKRKEEIMRIMSFDSFNSLHSLRLNQALPDARSGKA
jgi:ASC-1-like (ASCH) protein